MVRTKVLFVFLFFLLADLFIACCKCDDPFDGTFAHKSLSMQAIDNSSEFPIISTSDTINKNAFGFKVKVTREKVACAGPTFSFMGNSAYAMKCDCSGQFVLLPGDTITEIQMVTLNDFDSVHVANSDISDYWRHYSSHDLKNLSSLRRELNTGLYSLDGLVKSIDLLLMIPPSIGAVHQFKLILNISNGKTIEVSSTPIYLL